jgi:hypothetical protein
VTFTIEPASSSAKVRVMPELVTSWTTPPPSYRRSVVVTLPAEVVSVIWTRWPASP